MEKIIGIYCITNNLTNKKYIGQSKDIYRRWQQHKCGAFDVKHSSYFNPFYSDIRKYGIDNFTFEIVESFCSYNKAIMDEAELRWMKKLDTLVNGYNIQASYGQKIILYNIETKESMTFMTFNQVEDWLHHNKITSSIKLKPFLERAIKAKSTIYMKYKIYYWKEN